MTKSNFQKVKEFNQCFGVETVNKLDTEVTKNNPSLAKLRLSLINEECKELNDAAKDHDFVEIVDALADILYVVYGMGDCMGVDLDKAFSIVHESNMSKICRTEEEAIDTVEWYKNNQNVYDSPSYKKSEHDPRYWIVYNESTGKVLKSIKYTPANFEELLKQKS